MGEKQVGVTKRDFYVGLAASVLITIITVSYNSGTTNATDKAQLMQLRELTLQIQTELKEYKEAESEWRTEKFEPYAENVDHMHSFLVNRYGYKPQ